MSSEPTDRTERWASTMAGHAADADFRTAHFGAATGPGKHTPVTRELREEREAIHLSDGATLAIGAGRRAIAEEPDPWRTCFERDRDRILHASAFRRLSGKTQVFVFPADHQRTRMTHALEVAQVAVGVAQALGLNTALTEAIALGHDCGHGPGGHASEDALSPYLPNGYDHAVWGADVVLTPLNLCSETLDGIRNHSWSRPASATPEGEVVAWADRIAYVCHDFEDAESTGLVQASELPGAVRDVCGLRRSTQISVFMRSMIDAAGRTGRVGMGAGEADALAAFRAFNYEQIYLRPASVEQAKSVIAVLRALVDRYLARPDDLPLTQRRQAEMEGLVHTAVSYVGGMTDRYACQQAVLLLDWPLDQLPRGVGGL
jgi:dGTPase